MKAKVIHASTLIGGRLSSIHYIVLGDDEMFVEIDESHHMRISDRPPYTHGDPSGIVEVEVSDEFADAARASLEAQKKFDEKRDEFDWHIWKLTV